MKWHGKKDIIKTMFIWTNVGFEQLNRMELFLSQRFSKFYKQNIQRYLLEVIGNETP